MTVDKMMDLLEHAYKEEVAKRKSYIKIGEESRKYLHKAAEKCLDHGYDPDMYVAAQARYHTTDQFYANQLVTKWADTNYQKYLSTFCEDPIQAFEVQKGYLRTAILRTQRTVEEILMDDLINFSPWFRIIITKEPVPEIVKKYKKVAAAMMTPKLERYLRDLKLDTSRIYGK
jgi:hypothetical protein